MLIWMSCVLNVTRLLTLVAHWAAAKYAIDWYYCHQRGYGWCQFRRLIEKICDRSQGVCDIYILWSRNASRHSDHLSKLVDRVLSISAAPNETTILAAACKKIRFSKPLQLAQLKNWPTALWQPHENTFDQECCCLNF